MDTPENEAATGLTPEQELELLKTKAKTLGIAHSGNIGVDKLRQKINDHMEGNQDEKPAPAADAAPEIPPEVALRAKLKKEKLKLVRCRIYNMDPKKADLRGEIITVGNRFIGTVRKFIPFGEATDNGYHIPQVLYDHLKARKFQQIKTKTVKGQIQVTTRDVPEYNIEVLDPLTAEELEDLKIAQEAANRVNVD